ncbi:hypothetical protein [Mesorhizobium sp. 1M-11]|uniref:hypothetical protein n=1 Tax=Mesorhizobium sp. 1M-11 TaxID=1529006 RepID=UPI0006C75E61|nr:hypothetical protein [Mesorhizobium sp. 1M-11]
MMTFRFPTIVRFHAAIILGVLVLLVGTGGALAAPVKDLHQYCRQVRNDDTVRTYEPSLRDAAIRAYQRLFPGAQGEPSDEELDTSIKFRCMDAKVMACFLGANLVCDKMNTARENPGADEFCRSTPNSDFVPLVATGHDTIYAYRCSNGKAVVDGKIYALDKRGFAQKLWIALPDR